MLEEKQRSAPPLLGIWTDLPSGWPLAQAQRRKWEHRYNPSSIGQYCKVLGVRIAGIEYQARAKVYQLQ